MYNIGSQVNIPSAERAVVRRHSQATFPVLRFQENQVGHDIRMKDAEPEDTMRTEEEAHKSITSPRNWSHKW